MQRGCGSSPCCLQAVTVWITALQPPLTITDPLRHDPAGFRPTPSRLLTRSDPSPDSHLRCSQRSFLHPPPPQKKSFVFKAASNFCAPRSLRSTWLLQRSVARMRGASMRPLASKGSKGLMGFRGLRERVRRGDTKVTFLLIVWTK